MKIAKVSEEGKILALLDEDTILDVEPHEHVFLLDSYSELRNASEETLSNITYNFMTKRWEKPPQILDFQTQQNLKLQEIKDRFEQTLTEGFVVFLGFKMDCDFISLLKLNAAMNLAMTQGAPRDYLLQIRDYDNVTHEVTLAQLEAILVELGNYVQFLYGKKWQLQDVVNNVQTEEALQLITWEN